MLRAKTYFNAKEAVARNKPASSFNDILEHQFDFWRVNAAKKVPLAIKTMDDVQCDVLLLGKTLTLLDHLNEARCILNTSLNNE